MQLLVPALVVASLTASSAVAAEDSGQAMPAGAVSINAAEIAWADGPPDFPKGLKIAVLHGDPGKSGPFTLRVKAPDGYRIPGHWHSQDERLTILSGTFVLHLGDDLTAPAHGLTAGGFHFLPAKMHHAAEAKGETIVQVEGSGPFDIHYLKASDDPRQPAK